jgi:hypothetical protein
MCALMFPVYLLNQILKVHHQYFLINHYVKE